MEAKAKTVAHCKKTMQKNKQGWPPTSRGGGQDQNLARDIQALIPASLLIRRPWLHLFCSPWEKVHGRTTVATTSYRIHLELQVSGRKKPEAGE